MSFGMAERQQVRAHDDKVSVQEKKPEHKDNSGSDDYDDLRLSTSSIIELDRKDLLIVKDGTVRVAESLDREQQQLDANGEVVKASGTWTKAEHERFLRAMETFPKGPWKAIAEMVATRTVRQTQTHAQKYREKLARRMRGLRNRNGTLQTPPMSGGMAPGMVNYQQHVSPYASVYQHAPHPGAMGYVAPSMGSMAVTTIPLVRASSLPAMPMHGSPLHQPTTTYASTPMSASLAMVSSAFSQLSTSTISSAFIGNASYPASWDANDVEVKPTVPNFDESMDFLMDVYSTNPSQINTSGLTVTPTACIPRSPQTPTPSLAMKRHPGYGFIQQAPMKHFTSMHTGVNREQDAKGV